MPVAMINRAGWVVNLAAALIVLPVPADAHVSEMGFVLLMPTELYVLAGLWTMALTLFAITAMPPRWISQIYHPRDLSPWPQQGWGRYVSLLSMIVFFAAIWVGINGSRDPLANPLPLLIWTIWWVGLAIIQGFIGDIWRWLNPWSGLVYFLQPNGPPLKLPAWLGVWPALALLLLFAGFAFAHPAPDDPNLLALAALSYWLLIAAGMFLFGEDWRQHCEFFTVLTGLFAGLTILSGRRGRLVGAFPGWQLLAGRNYPLSSGCFALSLLAVGSFDGLNETFWWFAKIGVNPLMFPGRSAVIGPTLFGLMAANVLLYAAFGICTWLGLRIARSDTGFGTAFGYWALSTLPIALAYHFAHYLVTLMINLQYALAALSDPLTRGADLLGLGTYYVTTGFLNTKASVEAIFRTQALAVVIGHVCAIVLAHQMARVLCRSNRQAILSQVPLAIFMIAYTFLGLWLLAAAKGA